jgi:hypothetical protein
MKRRVLIILLAVAFFISACASKNQGQMRTAYYMGFWNQCYVDATVSQDPTKPLTRNQTIAICTRILEEVVADRYFENQDALFVKIPDDLYTRLTGSSEEQYYYRGIWQACLTNVITYQDQNNPYSPEYIYSVCTHGLIAALDNEYYDKRDSQLFPAFPQEILSTESI